MRLESRQTETDPLETGSTPHYKTDPNSQSHTLKAPTNTFSENFQESPWLLITSELFLHVKNVCFWRSFLYSFSSPPQSWFP